ERAGVYRLERWMAEREAEAAAVKAADPGDDPERRLSAMAESMSMSSRPAADLAAEARALLAQGDARGAEVRLNAAKLTGQMHPGAMRALQAEVDAALDEAVPHRRAAVQAAYEARVRRYSAQLAMIAVGKAARDLSHTDPARPEEAVAAARAMATKPSP
ncbi:MAG: hypothetical protein ABI841_05740, partial [Chloroflexota bacterium]